MIAALYVEEEGIYFGLPEVDPWDERRDARLYAGPWPVVAHPPCTRWSTLAALNVKHGHEIGDDGGCFAAALASVREFGGVLEHPAYSFAWPAFGLPRPGRGGWTRDLFDQGWTTEVSQVAYGHPARKRTWLYYAGTQAPPALNWSEPPATLVVSDAGATKGGQRWEDFGPSVQYAEAERTPLGFRDVLLDLARFAR